jgi:hypothetical protein
MKAHLESLKIENINVVIPDRYLVDASLLFGNHYSPDSPSRI